MKVFLAPLYFVNSFCKHCVRKFYREFPDEWWWQQELRSMPPLGYFERGSGFIPDYSLLTMFDEFIISEEAYDRILSKTAPDWLANWLKVVQLLKSEGALTTVDIDSELKAISHKRGWMLRRDMEKPAIWADAMTYHDSLMSSADKAYGEQPTNASEPTWEFDVDSVPGISGSDGKRHMLSSIPLTDPGENKNDPHYQLHNVALDTLGSQLREINAGIALSKELRVAPMFWAPYRDYLAKKSERAVELASVKGEVDAAKLFFKVAFHRYSPDTVDQLARLRSDSRITLLRSEIRKASETGDLIDPSYPQRVLEEAFHLERRMGKIRQVSGWISSAVGLIPPLGIPATLISELIGASVEKSIKKDLQWFYLISDGTGHT